MCWEGLEKYQQQALGSAIKLLFVQTMLIHTQPAHDEESANGTIKVTTAVLGSAIQIPCQCLDEL
eukprot:7059669-Ditylum_brightwellii.AAC.1